MFLLQESQTALKPTIPYENNGACPFECCTYGEWTANKEVKILQDRRDGSSVAYQVVKDGKVTAEAGVVITTKPKTATLMKRPDVTILKLLRGPLSMFFLTKVKVSMWFGTRGKS